MEVVSFHFQIESKAALREIVETLKCWSCSSIFAIAIKVFQERSTQLELANQSSSGDRRE